MYFKTRTDDLLKINNEFIHIIFMDRFFTKAHCNSNVLFDLFSNKSKNIKKILL